MPQLRVLATARNRWGSADVLTGRQGPPAAALEARAGRAAQLFELGALSRASQRRALALMDPSNPWAVGAAIGVGLVVWGGIVWKLFFEPWLDMIEQDTEDDHPTEGE